MDRRIFLKSLLGVAGSGAACVAFAPSAEAAPLLDELAAMDAQGSNPLSQAAAHEADLPAPGAHDAQYYYRRRPRRRYYRPLPPARVRRCRTFYDRFGRLVRRCWWG